MKKKICALALATIIAVGMAGCGSASEESQTAKSVVSQKEESISTTKEVESVVSQNQGDISTSEEMEIANPWTESDRQGVLEATGYDMEAPDGATDVSYSYMTDEAMAQMSYELDGASWLYRMQATDELTNISGMNYGWTNEEEGTVSGMTAEYYSYTVEDAEQNDVQLVVWYDPLTAVSYSLCASGEDLNGMDIQAYAESIYVSLQGEATDDADADRETELNDYFLGEHKRSSDESVLTISENEDGTFNINLSITKLCNLENGVGTFEDHKMTFVVQDPSENELSGVIYRDSDNSLTVKITESTWELLPTDEILDGFGK